MWTYRWIPVFRRTEDGGSMFLRKGSIYLQVHTASIIFNVKGVKREIARISNSPN
jgi:hypothetical protein